MEERPMLLILYATQTGNALDVAEQVGREAERRACAVRLLSLDEYDAVSQKSYTSFYFPVPSSVRCLIVWKLFCLVAFLTCLLVSEFLTSWKRCRFCCFYNRPGRYSWFHEGIYLFISWQGIYLNSNIDKVRFYYVLVLCFCINLPHWICAGLLEIPSSEEPRSALARRSSLCCVWSRWFWVPEI